MMTGNLRVLSLSPKTVTRTASDLRQLTITKPTRLVVGLGSSFGPKPNELLIDRLRVGAQ